jgi:tetratricopeptide (TPR) repeat protein
MDQRTMMRAAGRYYGSLVAGVLLTVLLVAFGVQRFLAHEWAKANQTISQEQRQSVVTTVNSLRNGRGPAIRLLIRELKRLPHDMVADELQSQFDGESEGHKLPLAYALAEPEFGSVDRSFLIDAISYVPNEECDNIATALAHNREQAVTDLKRAAADATEKQDWKRKARLATVALYLGDTLIAAEMLQAVPRLSPKETDEADPQSAWNDPPLDPGWKSIDDSRRDAIVSAHGMITNHFAYCLDMPWQTFLTSYENLKASGYRLTRVRPYTNGGQLMVAAIWMRDGKPSHFDFDRTAEQLPSGAAVAEHEGMVPQDVAAYSSADRGTLYCLLWSPPRTQHEQRCLRVGITHSQWETTVAMMRAAGLPTQLTLQAFVSEDNTRNYAGIWSTMDDDTIGYTMTQGPRDRGGRTDWTDASIASTGRLPNSESLQQERLLLLDHIPSPQKHSVKMRLARAKIYYYLDRPHDALEILNRLVVEWPTADTWLYYALSSAQVGAVEAAEEAMERLLEICQLDSDSQRTS